MKRILLLIALLLALPATAQVTTASIGGRISDGNGPIEGVTVVAIHQPTNAQYDATTDANGWWQLPDILPGGPYTVRIHYFGYKPLTVRNLFAYAGQHSVVDADLEAGTSDVHLDEAATSFRIGEGLGGGIAPVAPGTYDLVGQRVYTEVPFDVRQEATLDGASRLQLTPVGTNRFHGSVYGYLGASVRPPIKSGVTQGAISTGGDAREGVMPGLTSSVMPGLTGHLGATLSTPLASEDFLLFGGLQYDKNDGLSGSARFDARLSSANRLDLSGIWLPGDGAGISTGLSTALLDGRASNRAQAGWNISSHSNTLFVSDDFTLSAGAHRLLFGVQAALGSVLNWEQAVQATHHPQSADSAFTNLRFYLQEAFRMGRRLTLQAGVRFDFPFAFSPRLSVRYDLKGTGALVLRAGTAVYGVHGEGSVWKNLAAVDTRLPGKFYLTLEGIYGQSWRKPFYISTRNVLDSRYALTARLERPFADRLWAVASYTHSDGTLTDQLIGGFSYTANYLGRMATTLAVLYQGCNAVEDLSSASLSWTNAFEARLTQDLGFALAGRDHTFQLTGYFRYGPPIGTGHLQFLAGLRYLF